jgi:hypothetical protein
MGKTRVAWHPYLLACTIVLVAFRDLGSAASLGELMLVLAILVAAVWLAERFFRLLSRSGPGAALALSLLILLVAFSFDIVSLIVSLLLGAGLKGLGRFRYVLPAATVGLIGCLVWFLRTRREHRLLQRYLNWASAAVLLATLVQIGANWHTHPAKAAPATQLEVPPLAPKRASLPDIYLILVDGYTGNESLKQYWSFDNSGLAEFLGGRGFQVVSNAVSSYAHTQQTLAAVLNMNYIPPALTNADDLLSINILLDAIDHSTVPLFLRSAGYDIVNLSLFKVAEVPPFYHWPFLRPTRLLDLLWRRLVFARWQDDRRHRTQGDTNLRIFEQLANVAGLRKAKPRFVYAHPMMPHAPVFFDRNGRRLPKNVWDQTTKEEYLEQLIYTNHLLTNTIQRILSQSSFPPIIIIQADHGSRLPTGKGACAEPYSVFCALLLPGPPEALPAGLSTINNFRIVFNRLFGANYPWLPQFPAATSASAASQPAAGKKQF